MPFGRPNLNSLRQQASADLAAFLPGADPLLPVSNLGVIADILAEGFHGNYAYLDFIAKQSVPFTAAAEALEGWAGMKGVIRKPATKAAATATFVASVGSVLPAGWPVNRKDGVGYVTLAEVTAGGGGSVTVDIEAVEAGALGTIADGAPVVLGQARAGIASTGAAVSLRPGADVEDDEAFRTRMLQVYAHPPQGGAQSDYVEWALQVPGVTRAWCVRNGNGIGTVVVYFMLDVVRADDGGFPDGTDGVATAEDRDVAATGDQLLVADHIYPLHPVTALVYAVAPARNVVTFTINLPGASAAVKAAVEAVIAAVFLAYGEPGGTVFNNVVESAISAIGGTAGFVITAEACTHGAITPGAAGNIKSNAGYLPVLGVVTWAP